MRRDEREEGRKKGEEEKGKGRRREMEGRERKINLFLYTAMYFHYRTLYN